MESELLERSWDKLVELDTGLVRHSKVEKKPLTKKTLSVRKGNGARQQKGIIQRYWGMLEEPCMELGSGSTTLSQNASVRCWGLWEC